MDNKFNLKKFITYTLLFAVLGALVISALDLTGVSKWIIIGIVAISANVMARR